MKCSFPLSTTVKAALMCALLTLHASAQTRDADFWIPSNTVNKIIVDDARGLIYIGGSFDYIGPSTGGSVMLDKTTGALDPSFPVVDGSVSAAVSDGSGGLFIGGGFTSVGGTARNFLAHITSAGTLSSWNPSPDAPVAALVIDNGILYVGGSFTSIDGQSDTCLASFDVATKTYNSSFQPEPVTFDGFSQVSELSIYGSKLYIAGYFDSVGTSARRGAAALDKSTGTLTSWDPSPVHWTNSGNVGLTSMLPGNGSIFVTGPFTWIGGQARRSVAQVDTVTGVATSWDADIEPYITSGFFGSDTTSYVNALLRKGDTLYVGGNFQGFQGQASYGYAALAVSNGAYMTGALPALSIGDYISLFALDGSTLYVSGEFSSVGGQQRKNIAAIDAETGSLLSWDPTLSTYADVLIPSGSQIYIGGGFYSVNGVVRNTLAAIDQTTGLPTDWNPNGGTTSDEPSINTMMLIDTVLYVGGKFTDFGTEPRTALAAIGIVGGSVLPFNPVLSRYQMFFGTGVPEVFAMAASGSKLYVGGDIDTADGEKRWGAAAFNLSDGSLASWNPSLGNGAEAGSVSTLAVCGEKVFIGGSTFETAGDSIRYGLAAVDTGSAAVYGWNPLYSSSSNYVYALTLDGPTLYVGGSFNTIGGLTRNGAAAFDTSSSVPTAWDPDLSSAAEVITVSTDNVYLGGFFQTVGGVTRYSIAAVNKGTGGTTSWDPQIDASNYVETIGISELYEKVYFGGSFNTVLGEFSQNFGAVTNPFDASLPVELTSFTADAKSNGVRLSWLTATEKNNYGFEIEKKRMKEEGGSMKWEKAGFVEGSGTSSAPKEYSFTDQHLKAGKYFYRLKQIDRDGKFTYSQEVEVTVGGVPKEFALEQNYPNPFNPSTTIGFTIQVSGLTTLKVYDAIGREVATLVNENLDAGLYHQQTFDASKLSSGIYFARLQSGGKHVMKKMLLVK